MFLSVPATSDAQRPSIRSVRDFPGQSIVDTDVVISVTCHVHFERTVQPVVLAGVNPARWVEAGRSRESTVPSVSAG